MAMHTRGDDNSTVRQAGARSPVVLDANMGHQGGHSPAIFKKRKVRKKASEVQTATMPQGGIGMRAQGQKARGTLPMNASGAFPTWPHALGVRNFRNTGPGGRMASKDPPKCHQKYFSTPETLKLLTAMVNNTNLSTRATRGPTILAAILKASLSRGFNVTAEQLGLEESELSG